MAANRASKSSLLAFAASARTSIRSSACSSWPLSMRATIRVGQNVKAASMGVTGGRSPSASINGPRLVLRPPQSAGGEPNGHGCFDAARANSKRFGRLDVVDGEIPIAPVSQDGGDDRVALRFDPNLLVVVGDGQSGTGMYERFVRVPAVDQQRGHLENDNGRSERGQAVALAARTAARWS